MQLDGVDSEEEQKPTSEMMCQSWYDTQPNYTQWVNRQVLL